jgi:hypothetical protein
MANNRISINENILVKVDQQNLVYIDPSSIVDNDGEIHSRLVDHENLVMYVNLEADLVPRTTLFSNGDENTMISIAGGELNFLRNQNGQNYDTSWTDVFTPAANDALSSNVDVQEKISDGSGQSFGFESINIVTKGANAIPEVSINLIDARGKTLFESPKNSPYQAFFHLPWPIFYLTVKGYYGKAIRYRLHMVDFKSKFNGTSGNFEITTKFVGSTFAYLNDILLQNILAAPYMYMVENSEPYRENTKTGLIEKKISQSTKGYSILKSVYSDYKNKKLIPENFPIKTLRDLVMTAESAERLLETQIFKNVVDFKVLGSVKEYENIITAFQKGIDAWGRSYLNLGQPDNPENDGVAYYPLTKVASEEDTKAGSISLSSITGTTKNALNKKINEYKERAYNNQAFGVTLDKNLIKDTGISLKTITFDRVLNKRYYSTKGGKVSVAFDILVNDINDIKNEFVAQRNELENKLETKMNEIIENDSDLGIGFKPTIRNIFAVICANADTYIRLMKDVHVKAIQSSKERQSILTARSIVDNKNEGLYPWPQVKKQINENTSTLMYPGDAQIANGIKANDPIIWPEVEFIETYESVATKRVDPLTNNEIDVSKLNYIFPKDNDDRVVNNISTLFNISNMKGYNDKTISNLLYEVYERGFYSTSYESFSTDAIVELRDKEYETIEGALNNDPDLKAMLRGPIYKEYLLSGTAGYEKYLTSYSPFERHPYYKDKIATVDYLKEIIERDFKIEEYDKIRKVDYTDGSYDALKNSIKKYEVQEYRFEEYPFGSTTYKNYLGRALNGDDFKFNDILSINSNDSFISSPIEPKMWINDTYKDNLFINKIELSGTTRNILNTPYFHNQIYSDFFKGGNVGRYSGSAYLLLNSLPFKDLDDIIEYNGNSKILMSNLFREVGASHFIPYHLILKWGSIYHRYKKYLTEGVDIISGVTNSITSSKFFDNTSGTTFNYGGDTTYVSGSTIYTTGTTSSFPVETVGFYPLYQDIFHQVVNGYVYFSPGTTTGNEKAGDLVLNSAEMKTNFASVYSSGAVKKLTSLPYQSNGITLSFMVDNSIFSSSNANYTVLPSFGGNQLKDLETDYKQIEQDSFKLIWDPENEDYPNYSGLTMPTYGEKFKTITTNEYSLKGNKRKVIDLMATFSPKMLDDFEAMFLEFSTLKLNTDGKTTTTSYKHSNFQELLREIVTLKKASVTATDFNSIIKEQIVVLKNITDDILKNENLVKLTIGNAKQIDNYTLYGAAGLVKTYSDNDFDVSQVTSDNLNLIKLYVGEDIDGHYLDYFATTNVELNEENIYSHRLLARIYAGYLAKNLADNPSYNPTVTTFRAYLNENIVIPQEKRFDTYFNGLMLKVGKLPIDTTTPVTVYRGFNTDKTTKLETYNFFKSFNDKWVSGNSLGQRNLLEEFLFLDRANKDIGNELYMSLDRLKPLADPRNANKSLLGMISILIQGNNIDFRPLPAYVNFYGTNFSDKKRITPSKNLARNLFGTFLEVDYQESSPKMILQYIGPSSKHLSMGEVSPKNKFKNDGADIRNVNKNPLLVSQQLFMDTDFSKSNRVVGFEVNFGDQAQSMFKNVSLSQDSKTPTSETFLAYENLGRSQSGSNTYQVDVNLFDLYRTYSYTCEVSSMGNAMIQPTMYFYLNNIPMFEGTYFITEVSHSIKANQIDTTFKGARIPNDNLPNIKDSFVAAYRPLFDKILKAAFKKKQEANAVTTTTKSATINGKTVEYDLGPLNVNGEVVLSESGFLSGIPYNGQNGEKYIQYVEHTINGVKDKWLRARVVQMGGPNYTLPNNTEMTVTTKAQNNNILTFGDINENIDYYFSTRFDFSNKSASEISNINMIFYNPFLAKNTTDTGVPNPLKVLPSINFTTGLFSGAVHNGLPDTTYGIAMSPQLMRKLKVQDGYVIYFKPE